MSVIPAPKIPSLDDVFSPKAIGGDLPYADVGFEKITPGDDGGSLWYSLVHQYNDMVRENEHHVMTALSHLCETSQAALMADFSVSKEEPDVAMDASVVKVRQFDGEERSVMRAGGRLKIPEEWRDMMDMNGCYMIFDERAGQILVMNQDNIDDVQIEENLKKIRQGYKERGKHFPRAAHYTPYPYYRSVHAHGAEKGMRIDPQVFNWTALAKDEIFDKPFDVALKGHGAYFSIERADGGWEVQPDQVNKIRNAMVQIARKAVAVKAHPLDHEQNQIALESGVS